MLTLREKSLMPFLKVRFKKKLAILILILIEHTIYILGLQYMIPETLLSTSGATWEYQPDPSLKKMLRKELKKHYENFTLRRFDKRNLPLSLSFWSWYWKISK